MSRTTETEFAKAVEAILAVTPNGEATIAHLIAEMPDFITLTDEDIASSPTRTNEPVWHQQIRNITSHKASPGNAIYEGRLEAVSGGLRLPRKAA